MVKFKRVCSFLAMVYNFLSCKSFLVENQMGNIHGIPQKIGQHLSLYVRDENVKTTKLIASGKTESIPIEKYLNNAGIFAEFVEIRAQASIGQVYRVVSKAGSFCVKAQYPNAKENIISDFKIIKALFSFFKLLPTNTQSIQTAVLEIHRHILQECDYEKEVQIQSRFHCFFCDVEGIQVPKVYFKYSSNRIIVSEWIAGEFISDYLENATGYKRLEVFKRLFFFQLSALFKLSIAHTDPHPGNFLIKEEIHSLTLVALDFGSVIELSPSEIVSIRSLLLGEYQYEDEIKADLVCLGFNEGVIEYYSDIISDLIAILLEPFYFDGDYSFEEWKIQYKINTVLSSKVWDRPLEVPPKLISLLRMFQGLYYYARQYCIIFNWNQGLRDILNEERQKSE